MSLIVAGQQTESADTDAPGLRVTCAPTTWRIVATNLLPRAADQITLPTTATSAAASPSNLVISIDGEEHPLQLGKPMVVSLGEKQRTITVRAVP